jgi:hypothetical protein
MNKWSIENRKFRLLSPLLSLLIIISGLASGITSEDKRVIDLNLQFTKETIPSTYFSGHPKEIQDITIIKFAPPVEYAKALNLKGVTIKKARENFIAILLERLLPDLYDDVCIIPEDIRCNIRKRKTKGYYIKVIDNHREPNRCSRFNSIWFDYKEKDGMMIEFMATTGFDM